MLGCAALRARMPSRTVAPLNELLNLRPVFAAGGCVGKWAGQGRTHEWKAQSKPSAERNHTHGHNQ